MGNPAGSSPIRASHVAAIRGTNRSGSKTARNEESEIGVQTTDALETEGNRAGGLSDKQGVTGLTARTGNVSDGQIAETDDQGGENVSRRLSPEERAQNSADTIERKSRLDELRERIQNGEYQNEEGSSFPGAQAAGGQNDQMQKMLQQAAMQDAIKQQQQAAKQGQSGSQNSQIQKFQQQMKDQLAKQKEQYEKQLKEIKQGQSQPRGLAKLAVGLERYEQLGTTAQKQLLQQAKNPQVLKQLEEISPQLRQKADRLIQQENQVTETTNGLDLEAVIEGPKQTSLIQDYDKENGFGAEGSFASLFAQNSQFTAGNARAISDKLTEDGTSHDTQYGDALVRNNDIDFSLDLDLDTGGFDDLSSLDIEIG